MFQSQNTSIVDNVPHLSSKSQSLNQRAREARQAARNQFWDTLSEVWLTPRALREFDRRNALEQTHTADLEDLWPRKRPPLDTSQLTPASAKNIERFARRGGPSLTNLRNVSRAMIYAKRKS